MRSSRLSVLAALLVAPLALASRGALAEPPAGPAVPAAPAAAPAAPAAPSIATAEQAAAALAKFKEDYKAKGLKGDDKLTQKDFALAALAKFQHPTIVDALAEVSRESDATLRMLGTIYLGDQTALPGAAGPKVAAAMKRAPDDAALTMSGLQSIGKLRFLGARAEIRDAMKSQNFALKKSALAAVGRTEDIRMLEDVLQIVGLRLPNEGVAGTSAGGANSDAGKDSGGKEQVGEAVSWEGAEASVDTGTSGDGDQKAAEAQAKAQAAANEAAARGGTSAGGVTGGAGGGEGGQGGKGGGGGRSVRELLPQVLGVLHKLTGQQFKGPSDFKKWYAQNRAVVAEKMKAMDEREKAQKAK